MAILDDFKINYDVRKIEHISGTTVYTVKALYTAVLQALDDLGGMDDLVPMSAQTPNAYRMINGWWLDISPQSYAQKYLGGGSIDTVGYDAAIYNDGIRLLKFDSATYVNAVAGDIGREVGYAGGTPSDTGTLLGYNNTLRWWWVRVDDTGDTFANDSTALDLDNGAGTGGGDDLLAASTTGEELYTNLYTIGTLATSPSPQVYIFQDGSRVAEWSTLTNWDRGAIDVLIQVKRAGTLIGTANSAYEPGFVTVFARQYADEYSHSVADLTGGGSVPVALGTKTDINNTSGSHYLLVLHTTLPSVGATITGGTSGATAEVIAVTDWTGEGLLELGNVTGVFQTGEAITGTGASGVTANGTLGDTYITYTDEATGPFTVGSILNGGSSGAQREIKGLQDDGTTGKMVLMADVAYDVDVDYYKKYTTVEALSETPSGATGNAGVGDGVYASTTVSSGYGDIGLWFVNGYIDVTSTTTFTVGKKVTGGTSGATGWVLEKTSGTRLTLGNIVDGSTAWQSAEAITDNGSGTSTTTSVVTLDKNLTKQFLNETAQPYNVIADLNSRTVQELYEYLKYVTGDTNATQMYPLYELTGGSTLGREVFDGQEYLAAYRDEDDTNTYAPVSVSPFGTFAGGVFFGARGVWIQDVAAADAQAYQLTDEDGDINTPPNYQAIEVTNLVSGDTVMVAISDGTNSEVVNDAYFTSHATNNGAADTTFEVQEAIPNDTPSTGILRIVKFGDAAANERIAYTGWSGSIFTLGSSHAGGYDGSDTAYVPYIDATTSSTSEDVIVVYVSTRNIVARVRRSTSATKILPFSQASTFPATGRSIAAIRTPDTIIS